MSHELLYTSAPKGLKSGSRGFCTVMCTQGMPAPLMAALESLSAYRHIYPPGDRHAAKNPVAWSHLKMNVAGRAYHVLSRVADFGLDYSQRGNKLAHHVALEAAEQTAAGPAMLLAQPGTMETDWDGQPRLLPAGRQLRSGSRPPAVCASWQALAGDAGWAGVLAESFLANPERQVYIVFAPGMDLLPLMVEAIALLPAESRWNVTFSTYFTSLPPGVTCAWRCVLSGSPEAEQGKKFSKALHVDLCQPVPPAVGGSLVQAARTGRAARPATTGPQFATAQAGSTESEPDAEWELRPAAEDGVPEPGPGMPFAAYAVPLTGAEFGVALPPGMPPPPPPSTYSQKRRRLSDLNAADAARNRKRKLRIVGSLVVMALGLGFAVLAVPASRDWALRALHLMSPDDAVADSAKPLRAGRNKNARQAQDDDEALDPADTDDIAGIRGDREARADDLKRPDKASSAGNASSKSAAKAPNADEKIAADKTPSEDRPAEDPIGDKPDAAPKKNSLPQDPPRFGNRDLAIVRDEDDYSLFAINLEDALHDGRELVIPIRNGKSCTWELFAPVGRPEIRFKQKGDDTKVATIPREEGVGSNVAEVLSVTRSYDHAGCTFRFEKLGEGWERIKWCLLSVSPPNSRTRLFALKEPVLAPGNRQFDAFSYALQLARKGFDEAIPTIFVDAVEIACFDGESRLRFENPTGATHEGFLSCEIPQAIAGKMLFPDADRRLEMKLTQTSERVTAKMTLLGPGLNKIFDRGVDHEIEKIEKQNANLWLDLGFTSRREKLKNELHTEGPEKKNPMATLNDLEDVVRTRAKDAQQERPVQQARVEELKQMLADLKALETARATYLKFKEGLKNAEVQQLRLHYDFESKADKGLPRRLSIRLEYVQ